MNNGNHIQRRTNITLQHLCPSQPTTVANVNSSISFATEAQVSMQDTCGIIGVVCELNNSIEDQAGPFLVEGLHILQNRGYDSAGMVTIDPEKNSLVVSKFASVTTTSDAVHRLEQNLPKHKGHKVGIAHTRWATHGAKTDNNAHPHCDYKNRIALVHNGVIENASELKKKLQDEDHIKFLSETDTEVIAQLIGHFLDKNCDILEALQKTIGELEGTWGLSLVTIDKPDRIFCCRNGSPMVLGLCKGKTFVASESSAFSRYTREIITLDNGEIAVISSEGVVQLIGKQQNGVSDLSNRISKANDEAVRLSPHPYPHWTIREISEQPQAVSRSLNFGGRISSDSSVKLGGLDQNKDWLLNIKHLIIAACGTSYYAGLYGAKLFRMFKCFDSVQVIDAAELEAEDFPEKFGGLLVISQSGETSDVMRSIQIATKLNVPCFSVVNKVGSLIARTTSCGVYINAGREIAVASTKAFTCQVTVLSLVVIFFAQNRHHYNSTQLRQGLVSDLHRLPISIGTVLNSSKDKCTEVAKMLKGHNTVFVLGKGVGECIAREGALKIKEITYTHAEAYASGALKHGPFALISEGTPIFILLLNDQHLTMNRTAAHEVKARGAKVIAISDAPKEKIHDCADVVIPIPSAGVLTGVLAVIPLQLIAYELAILKNINPDKPKNLAKTVTVL